MPINTYHLRVQAKEVFLPCADLGTIITNLNPDRNVEGVKTLNPKSRSLAGNYHVHEENLLPRRGDAARDAPVMRPVESAGPSLPPLKDYKLPSPRKRLAGLEIARFSQ